VVSYKPGQMTLDISEAYPKEAHVRWWKRTVKTGNGRRVEVTEDYSLYDYDTPSQLMLMTVVQPRIDKAGKILLGDHSITYDARQLEVAVEDVSDKMDAVLRGMWGNKMYRIVMTVRQQKLKDRIKYYIQ